MKPSERIEEIRKQMIRDEWVNWAGNRWSAEEWDIQCAANPGYLIRAMIAYLDESEDGKYAE